jgi:hypothetical protein
LPLTALIVTLLGNAAGDARATTPQRRWLVGVIIAASVDHYGTTLNVGQGKVRYYNSLRGVAVGIDG